MLLINFCRHDNLYLNFKFHNLVVGHLMKFGDDASWSWERMDHSCNVPKTVKIDLHAFDLLMKNIILWDMYCTRIIAIHKSGKRWRSPIEAIVATKAQR